MHYGEFPLSIAACTGQRDVVAYLKRHGARVDEDRDVQLSLCCCF
jgi:ankyrin repeat protein